MRQATRGRVIVDSDLLSDTYVPETFLGREKQVEELQRWLATAVDTRTPVHLWLHGPSGAGKTAVAVRTLAGFRDSGRADSAIINCWEHGTYFEVLDALVGQLKILRAEEHRSSLKLERIRRHLGGRPFIMLLDEVDQMRPGERGTTLYNFARLGTISLVAIANDERALLDLDERVRSRLNPQVIAFPAYREGELVMILKGVAAKAFVRGAVSANVLEKIAEIAAGDARVAIRVLWDSVHAAEQQGKNRLAVRDLEGLRRQVRDTKSKQLLKDLTEDHRILHQIVADSGEITSSVLWQEYLDRCSRIERKPLARRTFTNYAGRLSRAGLVGCEQARVKGRERLFKVTG